MGRTGITQLDVSTAAQQILDQGASPTIDTVREAMGSTGSKSTISKYLKAWKEQQPTTSSSSLPGGVLTALEAAYEQLKVQSYQSARDLEENYTKRLGVLSEQLENAQQRCKESDLHLAKQETRIAALDTEADDLKQLTNHLESQLALVTSSRDAADLRIAERDVGIRDLKNEIQRLHKQQQHFEASTAATRESERVHFQLELAQVRQERDVAQNDRDQAHLENKELALVVRSLETRLADLETSKSLTEQHLQKSRELNTQLQATIDSMGVRIGSLDNKNARYQEHQSELQRNNKQLTIDCDKLEKHLAQRSSEVERLTLDIATALQEKAILQGQCKQLEKMLQATNEKR